MSVKDTDGSLQVMFYKSHYGHRVKLEYIRLDQRHKNVIATQVLQGVSSTKILDKIRERVGEDFQRIYLVNKNDIRNITHTYKIIDGAIRDQNHAVSVDMFVGKDFLLAFMTISQKELLHKFGNKGIICMDQRMEQIHMIPN